ncbi:MAG: GAF domain-containing protein [Raineya sp.]|jgi:GAF domain-containing protein|nr:GAF domain-containing protein [Raineya sp.]
MAESVFIPQNSTRKDIYDALLPQIDGILQTETDLTANLANFVAVLKEAFGFFWIGFYWVKNEQLVLAPFQGTLACTRIAFGKGVCGASWKEQKTILVPDVDAFPGHIACSSLSKSEVVVPVFQNGKVVGVLDVDSDKLNDFDDQDQIGLENLIKILEKHLPKMQ